MPLPGNVNTITVTATYAPNGLPFAGDVTFRPNVPTLVDATAPAFVLGSVIAKLDTNGHISQVLALNDNTTLNPSGWLWEVTENIFGLPVRPPYLIRLTADMGPTVDLADPRLTPVNPAPPYSTVYGLLALANVWLQANNFANGLAIGGTTIVPPPGGTSRFLAADGTWQTPPTGGGGGSTTIVRDAFITSGSITFNSDAAFTAYPAIGISIPASVGDKIAVTFSGMWAKVGGDFLDEAILVGGGPVMFASSRSATAAIEGLPWWYPDPAFLRAGGVFSFTVAPEHIDTDGSVHVSLMHKGPAGGTWFANTNYCTYVHAVNYGH